MSIDSVEAPPPEAKPITRISAEPPPPPTPASGSEPPKEEKKIFLDGDLFEHMIAVMQAKLQGARRRKFGDVTISFFEAEAVFKLLTAGAERSEKFNQYVNHIMQRDGTMAEKVTALTKALEMQILPFFQARIEELKTLSNFLGQK